MAGNGNWSNTSTMMASDGNLTDATTVDPPSAKFHPYGVVACMASIWILVAILGIVGNTMVIMSVILSRHVRTMTNVLVINLSVADLWTSLSLPWTSLVLLTEGDWPLQTVVPCEIAAFMWHTGLGASLYNLALIALNRLIRITCSITTYKWIYTPRKMACIVFLSWFVPVFIIAFPVSIGVGSLGLDRLHDSCTDDELHEGAHAYNLIQTIGFFPIPMITVIVSYTVIFIHVRRHFGRQMGMNKSKSSGDMTEQTGTSMASVTSASAERETSDLEEGHRERKRKVSSEQQMQITKNLFWVCFAFTVCIAPYFTSLFIPTSASFALPGATILIVNSCVNPIIYAAKHPQFKVVLRPMLLCRWSDIPQPSRVLRAILARGRRNDPK